MADFDNNRFASKKQEYETPKKLFDKLNNEFNFTIDVCADTYNKKVEKYYSEEDDALTKDWDGICWMNPPYKDLKTWIAKAYKESLKGATVVCLIPARTNTNWWHEYCMRGEIRFIKGRPKFEGCKYGLLAIIVFGRNYKSNYKTFEYKN